MSNFHTQNLDTSEYRTFISQEFEWSHDEATSGFRKAWENGVHSGPVSETLFENWTENVQISH